MAGNDKERADQAGEQTTLIESIKGWVMFFGILTIVSLVLNGLQSPTDHPEVGRSSSSKPPPKPSLT